MTKIKEESVMIAVSPETRRSLQLIKLEREYKTVAQVIDYLLDIEQDYKLRVKNGKKV